ncbi:MAG: cation diffusion facilitator family transporter [Melioribacteraceae bacterium]|nr:cation diffusion facilitator family transporter [Melioribacteraceae bacterium]
MSHDHNITEIRFNKQFKIATILNLAFVVVELVFGIVTNSLALISDAGHNFGDVIGLLIAWGAAYLVQKKPTTRYTYGFKKSSIIAAQLNSLILLVAIGIIIWEAVNRINNPPDVDGAVMMLVAGIGVVINGITTFLFLSGRKEDLNIKGAYLHMLADTVISLGVVISGLIIYLTNLFWIDPAISIIIALMIFWSTYKLLRDSTKLSLDAVPDSINIEDVKLLLDGFQEINEFHDLHIWALSTTESALTVHLTIDRKDQSEKILQAIQQKIKERFGITHCTIQIEERKCNNGC